MCDGEADCAQSEDEENCHGTSDGGSAAPGGDSGGGGGSGGGGSGGGGSAVPCAEFLCLRSGGCVPYAAVCNGRQDCADNSDELGCGLVQPSEFQRWP